MLLTGVLLACGGPQTQAGADAPEPAAAPAPAAAPVAKAPAPAPAAAPAAAREKVDTGPKTVWEGHPWTVEITEGQLTFFDDANKRIRIRAEGDVHDIAEETGRTTYSVQVGMVREELKEDNAKNKPINHWQVGSVLFRPGETVQLALVSDGDATELCLKRRCSPVVHKVGD